MHPVLESRAMPASPLMKVAGDLDGCARGGGGSGRNCLTENVSFQLIGKKIVNRLGHIIANTPLKLKNFN